MFCVQSVCCSVEYQHKQTVASRSSPQFFDSHENDLDLFLNEGCMFANTNYTLQGIALLRDGLPQVTSRLFPNRQKWAEKFAHTDNRVCTLSDDCESMKSVTNFFKEEI